MSVLMQNVLVLNKSWRPVSTTTVRDAVTLIYTASAEVVDPVTYATLDFENWAGAAEFAKRSTHQLRGYGVEFGVPEIIRLSNYNGRRLSGVGVNRRNLFARDRNTCQYCGREFRTSELTLDHVVPKSRGGVASWTNLVVACVACNQRKANRTPKEARMKVLRKPRRPHPGELAVRGLGRRVPRSWEAFLSELYWNQELAD